jgi:hypothetical protein
MEREGSSKGTKKLSFGSINRFATKRVALRY